MNFINQHIKWILLIAGVATVSMISVVFAPEASLQQFFGEALTGAFANTIAQSWGSLITLVGLMLIIAAFKPHLRVFVAGIAGVSKLIYVGLLLKLGGAYLDKALMVVVFDTFVGLVLLAYAIPHILQANSGVATDAVNRHALIAAKVIIAIAFLAAGIAKLMGVASVLESFHVLGLPIWFAYLTAVAQIGIAIALFIRPLAAIAAFGGVAIMLGAVYFHIVHPPLSQGIPAAVLVLLSAYVFWKTKSSVA